MCIQVYLTDHVKKRMSERNIHLFTVIAALDCGQTIKKHKDGVKVVAITDRTIKQVIARGVYDPFVFRLGTHVVYSTEKVDEFVIITTYEDHDYKINKRGKPKRRKGYIPLLKRHAPRKKINRNIFLTDNTE
jgi:hypothetical protein